MSIKQSCGTSFTIATGLLLLLTFWLLPLDALAQTERVSVASGGTPGNGDSRGVDISGDGRYVVFTSGASNLVPGGNATFDIYVRDRLLGLTELVSKNNQGESGNFTSLWPSISSDGRFVVFHSIASNLVSGDTNFKSDVFLFDRQNDTITLVSRTPGGSVSNGRSERAEISADGSFVIFESDATDLTSASTGGFKQVYGFNVATSNVSIVSRGLLNEGADNQAGGASVSRTGQYVVFQTFAQNISNCPPDCGYLYVRDITGQTTQVVPNSSNLQANRPAISGDGRYVAYTTSARTFVIDRQFGTSTLLDQTGLTFNPRSWSRFSDDGRSFVFWESQTTSNSAPYRLWRYNLNTGIAAVVSLDQNGVEAVPGASSPGTFGPAGISDDGRIVAFWSDADGIVENDTGGIQDVYIRTIRQDDEPPSTGPITISPLTPIAGRSFRIQSSADDSGTGGAAIISAEFAIDGGDWQAAIASDGSFDSPVENVERTETGLPAGPYEICVRATDGFDNRSDENNCAKLNVLELSIDPDLIVINIPDPPLLPGSVFSALSSGWEPLTAIQAFLESNPVLVAEQTTDETGSVSITITVPDDFPSGEHTLALVGTGADGNPRRIETAITISDKKIFRNGFEVEQ